MGRALWAVLVLVSSPGGVAPAVVAPVVQAASSSGSGRVPWDSLDRYDLENGLTVVFCHVEMAPVTVMTSFRVGSAYDPPGKSGLAHLASHVVFRAADDMPTQGRERALTKAHASEYSRRMDWEWSEFWSTVPAGSIETAVALEAYRLEVLARPVSAAALAEERATAILERQRNEDATLNDPVDERVVETLFPDGHPYHRPVTGTVEDLRALGPADVQSFIETWYRPSNAVVTIIGGFDVKRARSAADRLLGKAARQPAAATPPTPPAVTGDGRVVQEPGSGRQNRVDVAWAVPALFGEGDADAEVVSWLMTFRLARHRTSGLSGSVWHIALGNQGVLVFSLSGSGETSTERMLEWVDQEVRGLAMTPPPPGEMRKAWQLIEANFLTGYDGRSGQPELARLLRDYVVSLDQVDRLEWDVTRHRQVTAERVSTFAARVLRPEHRIVVYSTMAAPAPPPTPSPHAPSAGTD